jgi:hypothetical protein
VVIGFAMLLLVAQVQAKPPAALRQQLQSAIWSDLETNAMIGNGNWAGSLWYNAAEGIDEQLHIQQLRCNKRGSRQHCAFDLVRDGRPKMVLGESASVRLRCVAQFVRFGKGWAVRHTPPHKVGHSRTSMVCDASN